MTVQVLESFGLRRVESPRCDVCQGADESVTWVHEAGAYLCSTCRASRRQMVVPARQPDRAMIDRWLGQIAKGRRPMYVPSLCCSMGRQHTRCPHCTRKR